MEEPSHPGALGDEWPVPWRALNARHLAATGSMGAVHFVADQFPPDSCGTPQEYDGQRSINVRDKYFISFLLALWQDQYLQRTALRVAGLVGKLAPKNQFPQLGRSEVVQPSLTDDANNERSQDTELHERSRQLRTEVAEFDGACMLARTSVREAHNRFYDLARAGLHIENGWREVTRGLADLEAIHRQRHDQAMSVSLLTFAGQRTRDQQHIIAMQRKMEWVEIFLVGVYAVYLVHYLGENFGFPHPFVGWSILGGTAYTWVVTAIVLRPWESHDHPSPPPTGGFLRWLGIISLLVLPLAAYLWLGDQMKKRALADGGPSAPKTEQPIQH